MKWVDADGAQYTRMRRSASIPTIDVLANDVPVSVQLIVEAVIPVAAPGVTWR